MIAVWTQERILLQFNYECVTYTFVFLALINRKSLMPLMIDLLFKDIGVYCKKTIFRVYYR